MYLGYEEGKEELLRELKANRLAAYVGTRTAQEAGIPGLKKFYYGYADICKKYSELLPPELSFTEMIEKSTFGVTAVERKDLMWEILKCLKPCVEQGFSTDRFTAMLFEPHLRAHFTPTHECIVSTNYTHILTNCFDTLLEDAAQKAGLSSLVTSSYTYREDQGISGALYQKKSAIIHTHGRVFDTRLEDVVVSRESYENMLMEYPAFHSILHAIYTYNSMLFIGFCEEDFSYEYLLKCMMEEMNLEGKNRKLSSFYLLSFREKYTLWQESIKDNTRIRVIQAADEDQARELLELLRRTCPRTTA